MPLEDSLQVLETRLRQTRQSLENLLWATVEAQPSQGPGHALVDYYETAATDALDHARQALGCLQQVTRAPQSRPGVTASAKAFRQCTEHVSALVSALLTGPGSLPRLAALHQLAAERRGAWSAWVHGVKDALEECQQAVGASAMAVPLCWKGLLGQMLPALNGGAHASATGARIILNGTDAKVFNETEKKAATGRNCDEPEARQSER